MLLAIATESSLAGDEDETAVGLDESVSAEIAIGESVTGAAVGRELEAGIEVGDFEIGESVTEVSAGDGVGDETAVGPDESVSAEIAIGESVTGAAVTAVGRELEAGLEVGDFEVGDFVTEVSAGAGVGDEVGASVGVGDEVGASVLKSTGGGGRDEAEEGVRGVQYLGSSQSTGHSGSSAVF
ncbi:hypothetical protein CYMTET_27971 [Cymbomonas tetramitiformis]|uniref:Uncharacterized protein n=1 Tax=Cymbomonas tetramitiformis TaxID=36881 RepID=A0AAE0KWM2_9CHLO|nr:hypothetical protein CYMTET_27971 [Cymbomonas tetramitiformis]